MSTPETNHQAPGAGDDRLIDRLVDGELPDAERRQLLLRLEAEPDGWRRCALAFLEAQSWREAFTPLASPAPPVPRTRPAARPNPEGSRPGSWRPVARLTGLAAGFAAAFVLGWALRGKPAEPTPHFPVAQGEASAPAVAAQAPPSAPADGPTREPQPPRPAQPPARLDSVVKQWEQRGYQAETQKRLISMELKDGRKVDVPVQEVRLRYVGDRTY
jgi:hypothetical protein